MGINTQESKIGDHTYLVTTFGAIEGRTVLARLTNLFGPVLGAFRLAAADIAEGREVDEAGVVVEALAKFATTLSPKDFGELCDAFAKSTQVSFDDGARVLPLPKIFDAHFAANYMELIMWLWFAIKVNYASFFTGPNSAVINALLTNVQAKRSKPSISPKGAAESSGGSGDSLPTTGSEQA